MILKETMIKTIAKTIRFFLLLHLFLNNPCDSRRVGRGRERRLRPGSWKEEKACKEVRPGGKGKGKAGGKAGKASTCSPTTSPSLSERYGVNLVITRAPSAAPSVSSFPSVSGNPSGSPSSEPSVSPSSSSAPSSFPSTVPSGSPSKEPSAAPSESPSKDPSAAPSQKPSSVPSFAPSVAPSTSPSMDPSATPSTKPSLFPTSFPSFSPSHTPSTGPSSGPTVEPSFEPSLTPTITAAPSASMFPTAAFYETSSTDSGVLSTCISPDPSEVDGGNFNEDQILVFEYLLFLNETVLEEEEKGDLVAIMEDRIHEGLVQEFLKCDATQAERSFYVWGISSDPPDFISSDPCDLELVEETDPTPPNGTSCIVVQAALNMQVYFPPIRRQRILEPLSTTYADPQVMAESGDYLSEAMSEGTFNDGDRIEQTRFLAFLTEGEGHATIGGGGLAVAGAEGQMMTQPQKSRVVGGAMVMAAAALCLIVVFALVARRRKRRSDALLRHIDGMSTFSDFTKDDFGTEVVGDLDSSSLGWFSEDVYNGIYGHNANGSNVAISLDRQHDVHKCTSAFCQICLKQQSPTFIASNALNTTDILEDLRSGCKIIDDRSKMSDERSYSSPDTVIL